MSTVGDISSTRRMFRAQVNIMSTLGEYDD